MNDLQSTIGRIASNASLLTGSEEATRQGAILPVLSALGWQWHNIDEVVPEFGAGRGRVDYCLRSRGRSAVFVEVKRTGTELHPHQEQLLRYAFEEGITGESLQECLEHPIFRIAVELNVDLGPQMIGKITQRPSCRDRHQQCARLLVDGEFRDRHWIVNELD